ncbi:autotransporter assembly complex protein TamB [Vibrio gallaecicus]|uniref:Translocation/assembly module TamB domain-containing protein n=1 Tax=Vibrio gallaecicus TaxID=552386 RepID=A0ABV4NG35_9VIBR
MIKVMARWAKWSSISLISLLLAVVVFLATILFTNPGLNLVLWGAEKALPQLRVTETSGALFPRFTLHNLSFEDESLHVDTKLEMVTLAINPRCLLDPALCVDEIAIQGLDFTLSDLPEPTEDPAPETPPAKSIATPLPIMVNRIALSDINLNILGNQVGWALFSTAFKMNGDRLTIAPTVLSDLSVELASSESADTQENAEETQSQTAKSEPQPIVLPEVWIPINIALQRFDLNRFTLNQEAPVIVNHLGVEAKIGGNVVDVTTLELDVPQASANLSTRVELVGGYPIELSLDALVKETDISGQTVNIQANGSVAKLHFDSRFSDVIQAELSGNIQPLEPTLPFDLTLNNGVAQWPLKGKSDISVDIAQLKTSGSLDGYTLLLDTDIAGKDIPDLAVDLKGKGTLDQIDLESLTLGTLGGEVRGKVMANWAAPINWTADIALKDIQPGLQWPNAEGNISGKLQTSGELTEAGGWAVELPMLDIDGILRDYPLNIEGQLNASDKKATGEPKITTQGLVLSHGPNALHAKGTLDKTWNMDVEVNFPELAKSVPELAGKLLGEIHLTGQFMEPEADLSLNLEQVNWNDEATLEKLVLSGSVTPLPHPSADLTLSATGMAYQENTIDNVQLNVKGGEKSHELTLDVVSNIVSTSLAISGELTQKPSMIWNGALERMKVTSEQGSWLLDKSVSIKADVDKESVMVQNHCWTQAGSSVCLTEDATVGKAGEAKLAINQFNFDQIKQYIPEGTNVEGMVNATADAKWAEGAAPEVLLKVILPKGEAIQNLGEPVTIGWETIALNAEVKDNQLSADWMLDVTDNGDISGKLFLPDVLIEDKTVDAEFKLTTFNLDFLEPILGQYSLLQAELQSEIAVKGALMHPQVFGQFSVDGIQVKGDITPIDVNSGKVQLDFDGYNASVNADIITPDGKLEVEGSGDWQDLKDWNSNLRIFAEELKVNLPPMVKIKVVPDMTIDITPKLAKITGDISLPWGRIVVEELPPSAVGVSKDQVVLNENLEADDSANSIPFDVETNINISIGDDFQLAAFGLEGGLIGKLNVAQKDKGPFITGEVNIADGTYQSFGQDLVIKEGKILMNGPVDQPYVTINAIRNPDNTQDDVTAGVRVTGPATEPQIEIYSDPVMAQANALSYLLRGQDIDGESGGGSMTTTLIGLSLAKSGKVVGEIGEAFGVQDLQLDTAGSGDDSQVTVSGYILPGLQVKYGVGIFNSLGEFTVRYRLMQDLYVEAVSGLDSAVDLLYQFEFD